MRFPAPSSLAVAADERERGGEQAGGAAGIRQIPLHQGERTSLLTALHVVTKAYLPNSL